MTPLAASPKNMHELSIAEALIGQVEEEVERSGQTGRITHLDVTVGRLSGVSCDSLRFAFELLAPNTLVEGAKLNITEPVAKCRCHHCKSLTEIDDLIMECPKCSSREISIEGGRDLLLQSIELED